MVTAPQLRAWKGSTRDSSTPGFGGGEPIIVMWRHENSRSDLWVVMLCTGDTVFYDSVFLEDQSEIIEDAV